MVGVDFVTVTVTERRTNGVPDPRRPRDHDSARHGHRPSDVLGLKGRCDADIVGGAAFVRSLSLLAALLVGVPLVVFRLVGVPLPGGR